MRIMVTGGAGFIGSNLTQRLLKEGHSVISIDNFLLGKREYIQSFEDSSAFEFKEINVLDFKSFSPALEGIDLVFHLSSNSDILEGTKYTDMDMRLGTLATYNVLEAMRLNGVKNIIFSSTSAVYGAADQIPTKEDYGPLYPISFYGASKAACETLISAFSHNFDIKGWIFRFANVIGKNPTHGIVFDLIKKLRKNSHELEVLGDGTQSKPYLYVGDIVDGMIYGFLNASEKINLFNLACDGASSVSFIANALLDKVRMRHTKIRYTGGRQGWRGDVARVRLSTEKMKKIGWVSSFSSDEAVLKGIDEIVSQLW